jgi:hypothetical protein
MFFAKATAFRHHERMAPLRVDVLVDQGWEARLAPDGTLRKDGLKVVEGGKIQSGKKKWLPRPGLTRLNPVFRPIATQTPLTGGLASVTAVATGEGFRLAQASPPRHPFWRGRAREDVRSNKQRNTYPSSLWISGIQAAVVKIGHLSNRLSLRSERPSAPEKKPTLQSLFRLCPLRVFEIWISTILTAIFWATERLQLTGEISDKTPPTYQQISFGLPGSWSTFIRIESPL